MAKRQRSYRTYGSVAYKKQLDGSDAQGSRYQHAAPRRQSRPQVQPRERVKVRPHAEVRQQDAIAPFAVIGFAVVALCAALLVGSYAQLAVLNDRTVQLRSQLEELKTAEAILQAEYELAYDLSSIERRLTADGSMVKLQPGQIIYLDISEPDSIIVYESTNPTFDSVIQRVRSFFSGQS